MLPACPLPAILQYDLGGCDQLVSPKARCSRCLHAFQRRGKLRCLNLSEMPGPAAVYLPFAQGNALVLGFDRSGEVG